ncbi:MAG: 50S ribosomal protein L9 [Oscillospiraceae bacterium]|nr:50S ribosomal protein L9 [Oscillospiraceae bacterium]
MKVVLLQDIKGTGKKDALVEVSDGYARNYLFPRKLAQPATHSALSEIQSKQSAKEHHKTEELDAAKAVAEKINGKKYVVRAKAGSGDRLFGSVTAKEIAAAILESTGCEVDKRKIALDKDIKAFGTYAVDVKICNGVGAAITVEVCE